MKKVIIVVLVIAVFTALYAGTRKKTASPVTRDQAVASVKKAYPKYEDYPSNSLPPKTVEAVEVEGGWRVGMYVEGSGVAGILRADCFLVTNSGVVVENGFFQGEGPAKSINLASCTPKE